MASYRDRSGAGGITSYRHVKDGIEVTYRGGKAYTFTHSSAGKHHVQAMKDLAAAGAGLHGYIALNKPDHERG